VTIVEGVLRDLFATAAHGLEGSPPPRRRRSCGWRGSAARSRRSALPAPFWTSKRSNTVMPTTPSNSAALEACDVLLDTVGPQLARRHTIDTFTRVSPHREEEDLSRRQLHIARRVPLPQLPRIQPPRARRRDRPGRPGRGNGDDDLSRARPTTDRVALAQLQLRLHPPAEARTFTRCPRCTATSIGQVPLDP
jgi:hypothetical protein